MRAGFSFAIVLALIFSANAEARTSSDVGHARCEVTISYLRAKLSEANDRESFVVSNEAIYIPDGIIGKKWVSESGRKALNPAKHLLAKFIRDGVGNALTTCPSMSNYLSSAKIPFGKDAVDENLRSIGNGRFRYRSTIVTISKAYLSRSKSEAILYYSGTSGPMAGGDFLYYLRKLRSGWRVVSFIPVSVS